MATRLNKNLTVKRGDHMPPARVTCLDGENPKDISEAVSVRFIAAVDGEVVIDDNAPEVDGPAGVVAHHWVDPETDEVVSYQAEVEVTWPGGKRQTFPGSGFLTIKVTDDLG